MPKKEMVDVWVGVPESCADGISPKAACILMARLPRQCYAGVGKLGGCYLRLTLALRPGFAGHWNRGMEFIPKDNLSRGQFDCFLKLFYFLTAILL